MVAKPDRKPVGETGNAWNTAEPRANWGNLRAGDSGPESPERMVRRAGGQWAGLRKRGRFWMRASKREQETVPEQGSAQK